MRAEEKNMINDKIHSPRRRPAEADCEASPPFDASRPPTREAECADAAAESSAAADTGDGERAELERLKRSTDSSGKPAHCAHTLLRESGSELKFDSL